MGSQAIMDDRFWQKRMKRCKQYDHKFKVFIYSEENRHVQKCVRCGFERSITSIPATVTILPERVI